MMKTVFVKGNIIADSGYHFAKVLECLSRMEDAQTADIIIDGDLHLNEKITLKPYCIYKASEGITAIQGNLGCIKSPYDFKKELFDELDKIVMLSKMDYREGLQQIELKSLYGAVFGCFEAFITLFLSNMILGHEYYFNRFLLYNNMANYTDEDVIYKSVKEIYSITTHNLKKVKNIFENIFEINFPDYSKLENAIRKRHDIIHRFGRSVIGGRAIKFTLQSSDIVDLAMLCKDFVDKLTESMKYPLKKWEEG